MANGPGSPRHLPGVFQSLLAAAIGAICSAGVKYGWPFVFHSELPDWAQNPAANAVGAALVFGLIAFAGAFLRRRWHWTPKAPGDRLTIYVALLENDYSGDLRKGVIATIARPLAGVEVLSGE